MKALTASDNPISDLSPLAALKKLQYLDLRACEISDLSPLSALVELRVLSLEANRQVVDISPLAGLTKLHLLKLNRNRVVDISPLSGLTALETLWLASNEIVDVSPLAGLTQLEYLTVDKNLIVDYSPLDGLGVTHLAIDTLCLMPRQSIASRLASRSFPSVFAAWGGLYGSPVSNLAHLSTVEHIALHDVWWSPSFGLGWRFTVDGVKLMGNGVEAKADYDAVVSLNPNIVIIRQLPLRSAHLGQYRFYTEDFPFWLRDASGKRASIDDESYLLDFTDPGMQDLIVEQIVATAECGLYDGVFFDYWNEYQPILVNDDADRSIGYRGYEAEQVAKENIVRRARAAVGANFLILGNANRETIPRTAEWMNGTFMETGRDHDNGYTPEGLMKLERTLRWGESDFAYPQLMCLEGFNVKDEPPDTLTAKRWMRLFTTMSLTFSDGLVLFRTHNAMGHDHHWYTFYDTDLGKPIGRKADQYKNIDGLFIREFTKGWAVYNRSGAVQTIVLDESVTATASGSVGATHQLGDLDGEIYLKVPAVEDVNRDGQVNVLDLVVVANALGQVVPQEARVDVNGDGAANILDLVAVAAALQ